MFFSIISVTTDAILAVARNHPEKIGSGRQNRVGREPEPQVFFFTPKHILAEKNVFHTSSVLESFRLPFSPVITGS
jgi:hypothetical protein